MTNHDLVKTTLDTMTVGALCVTTCLILVGYLHVVWSTYRKVKNKQKNEKVGK